MYVNYPEIVKNYGIEETIEYGIEGFSFTEKFRLNAGGFADTVESLTKGKLGWGHGKTYYKKGCVVSKKGNMKITSMQLHEYFAHLNEVYFLDNELMKSMLPLTYQNMKDYYKTNFNLDF